MLMSSFEARNNIAQSLHRHNKQNISLDSGFGDTTTNSPYSMTPMNVPMTSAPQTQSQTHINKLLHTAAAANGLVDDVDALLMPIQRSTSSLSGGGGGSGGGTTTATNARKYENRPERNLWRTEEMLEMLRLMQATNAMQLLNDKNVKSEKIFRHVEELMHKNDYVKKSHVQIWTKWKFLKSTYTTSKRNGIVPKMIPPSVYEELHKMLDQTVDGGGGGGAGGGGGTSNNSIDGDSSNGVGGGGGVGGQLVIAGVEGGYQQGGSVNGTKDDAAFGMAHPIFGFRLGLVKQEPVDTGYEHINNVEPPPTISSAFNDIPEPVPFFNAVIKKEIDIQPCTDINPKSTSTATIPTVIPTDMIRTRRPRQVPSRYPNVSALAPLAISQPPTTILQPLNAKTNANKKNCAPPLSEAPMPPLRIAPFAKVPTNEVMNGLLKPFERPLPPLTMNPSLSVTLTPNPSVCTTTAPGVTTPTTTRLRSPATMNGTNAVQPRRLMGKSIGASATATGKLANDITVQTRGATAAAAAAMAANNSKLSELAGTEMTSQRDTMIMSRPKASQALRKGATPQMLNEPSTPTQVRRTPQQQQVQFFNEPPIGISSVGDGSSHNNNNHSNALEQMPFSTDFVVHGPPPKNGKRKQRLQQDTSPPAGIKIRRMQAVSNDFATSPPEDFDKPSSSTAAPRQEPETEPKDDNTFDEAMEDLCLSLTAMQREMICEFYGHQMELTRKEHEFQMQQDCLIMQAFQQQTNQLMDMAKRMFDRWEETRYDSRDESKSQERLAERRYQTEGELVDYEEDEEAGLEDEGTLEMTNGLNGGDDDSSGGIGLGLNVEVQLTEPDAVDEGMVDSEPQQMEITSKDHLNLSESEENSTELQEEAHSVAPNGNPEAAKSNDKLVGDATQRPTHDLADVFHIMGQMQSPLPTSSSDSSDSSDDTDDDSDDDSDDDEDDDDEDGGVAVNGGNQIVATDILDESFQTNGTVDVGGGIPPSQVVEN